MKLFFEKPRNFQSAAAGQCQYKAEGKGEKIGEVLMRRENKVPLILWVCCLFAGIGFYGYGDGPALMAGSLPLAGSFSVSGDLTGLEVIHDGSGTVYVFAQSGGAIVIARKQGAAGLLPCEVEGFPRAVEKVRQLRLCETGPAQYAAFIGSENGQEGLYMLGLDDEGGLVCYPLPESRTSFPIDSYAIRVSAGGSASVFVLSGGTLRLIGGAGPGGLRTVRDISSAGERVLDFAVTGDPRRRRTSGWYRFSRGGKNEISLFLELENSLIQRRSLGAYTESARIRSGMTMGGETTTLIMEGKRVELYRNNDSGIIAETAFEAPLPALRYISAAETGGERGLLVCGDENQFTLYGVIHERTGAPQFPVYLRPEKGVMAEMLYAGESRVLLVYSENRRWNAADIDLNRGLRGAAPLPAEGDYRAWFSPGPGEPPQLCFIQDGPEQGLAVYAPAEAGSDAVTYTQDWERVKTYSLPPELLAELDGPAGPDAGLPAMAGGFMVSLSSSVLVLEGPEGEGLQILRGSPRAFSRRINGCMYFAVYAGGVVSLYRQEE
jgi:hypothetical protein